MASTDNREGVFQALKNASIACSFVGYFNIDGTQEMKHTSIVKKAPSREGASSGLLSQLTTVFYRCGQN